ncbi:unnamed protein product [marine sediment metagenome]|uniref:Tetratricopeptide repeat protein n=1 Tax=marine sediment metagenome TaxID=412755 RepID=X1BGH3_9ZZZZ
MIRAEKAMLPFEKKHQKLMKKAEKLDKKTNLYQKHFLAGDQHYKEGAYEKAIKEWKTAKKIYVGAGYPYKQLPKAYRKLATSNFKQGRYKVALKWYRELESLVKEAKQLVKKGKALSAVLWNLKLGPRDEEQMKAIYLKLGIQK